MSRQIKPIVVIRPERLTVLEGQMQPSASVSEESSRLEVSVIFTDTKSALAALQAAGELAADLSARVRLVAPHAVSFAFPLDAPPVDIAVTKRMLLDIAGKGVQGPVETSVELYLCRDRVDALRQLLAPNSVVVIGGKRWWPNDAWAMASALRKIGHQVIFVPSKPSRKAATRKSVGDCVPAARAE